ncbi:MAG: hypothetical protein WD037_04445 [Balneolales bacterium]
MNEEQGIPWINPKPGQRPCTLHTENGYEYIQKGDENHQSRCNVQDYLHGINGNKLRREQHNALMNLNPYSARMIEESLVVRHMIKKMLLDDG